MRLRLSLLAVLILAVAFSSLASAQATRTWVSGVGDDANPCSRTAPCKTFAGAISKTVTGGIIDCLDPGGFGAVTITKSIMIDCSPVAGGILVSGTNGVVINAQTTDDVTLRSLNFDGLGTGLSAVDILQAGNVHLEHVKIQGFTVAGVTVNASNPSNLSMYDVTISDGISGVGGSIVGNGVSLTTSTGTVSAQLHDVRIFNTKRGIEANSNSIVSVDTSELAFNGAAVKEIGTPAIVTLIGCRIHGNSVGVQGISGAVTNLFGNSFTNNTTQAIIPSGGTVNSDGQNGKAGNAADGAPTGTLTKY